MFKRHAHCPESMSETWWLRALITMTTSHGCTISSIMLTNSNSNWLKSGADCSRTLLTQLLISGECNCKPVFMNRAVYCWKENSSVYQLLSAFIDIRKNVLSTAINIHTFFHLYQKRTNTFGYVGKESIIFNQNYLRNISTKKYLHIRHLTKLQSAGKGVFSVPYSTYTVLIVLTHQQHFVSGFSRESKHCNSRNGGWMQVLYIFYLHLCRSATISFFLAFHLPLPAAHNV